MYYFPLISCYLIFRKRFLLLLKCCVYRYFSNEFQCQNSSLNFTSADHGKSAADGIGGSVKGICDRYAACGGSVLSTEKVAEVVRAKSKIFTSLVSETEIEPGDSLIPAGLEPVAETATELISNYKKIFSHPEMS